MRLHWESAELPLQVRYGSERYVKNSSESVPYGIEEILWNGWESKPILLQG